MINLFYKKNGSITVFLSIILVPVLLFMSIMVDGAAYVLSKATVESAGELAANAALADYDTVLKEVYGLFAMSQAADDPQAALKENVMNYFQNSLTANGIIDEEEIWDSETFLMLQDIIDDAMGIDDASIPSLVRVELADTTEVNYIEGSSLANPDILRAQIVEYSQYRAPLNAGLSVLDSLGAFKKVAAQSEVLDSKTRVDDELSDVNETLKNFYEVIGEFDVLVKTLQDALDNAANADFDFEDAEKALMVCHSIILELEVIPLAECTTSGDYKSNYDDLVFLKKDANNELSFCTTKNGNESEYNVSRWATGKYLPDIEAQFDEVSANATGPDGLLASEYDKVIGYASYGGMTIDQPCNTVQTSNPAKLQEALNNYRDLSDALVDMEACRLSIDYAEIEPYEYPDYVENPSDSDIAAEYEEPDFDVKDTPAQRAQKEQDAWDAAEDAARDKLKADYDYVMQTKFEHDKATMNSAFESAIYAYGANSTKCLDALKTYQLNYITYHDRLKQYIAAIVDLITPIAEPAFQIVKDKDMLWNGFGLSYTSYIDYLDRGASEVKDQINELKVAVQKHETDITGYKEAVCENKDDTFSSNMSSKAKEIADKYEAEDVDEIMEQVDAVAKYVSNPSGPTGVEETLKSYKLGSYAFADFFHGQPSSNLAYMEGLIDNICAEYSAILGANIEQAKNSTFYQLDTNTMAMTDLSHLDNSVLHNLGSNPDNIHNAHNTDITCYLKRIGQAGVKPATMPMGEEPTVNIPAFYFYMVTCFGYQMEEADCPIKKSDMESYQTDEQETAEQEMAKEELDYSMSILDNVPSQGLGSSAEADDPDPGDDSSPFDFFRRAVATFQDIICAFDEFSGDRVVETMLVEEYIMNNFSRYSDITSQDAAEGDSSEPRMTYSNVEINKENNVMYGCEIEYMLYGKKGSSQKKFLFFKWGEEKGPEINVNCAKEDIFAARMMFNTVFAMTDAQIDHETLPPAMAIQAATSGVFPYQVAQSIIKICLALAESNVDVDRIVNKNIAMPLIKTRETWKFQLSGMQGLVKDVQEDVKNEIDNAIAASQETVTKGVQQAIDKAETDMEDLIEDVRSNVSITIRGCIDDNVNAVMECYTSAVENYYQQILTAGKTYDRTALQTMCETAATEYLNSVSLNPQVKSLIVGTLMTELNNTMLKEGGEIDTCLKEVQTLVTTSADDVKSMATELGNNFSTTMKGVSLKAKEVVDKVDNEVKAATNSIAKQVSDATISAVNNIYDDAGKKIDDISAQVSGTINSKMNEFFPAASVTTKVEMTNNKTSSSLGTSFVMGYDDYLRVFLFIKLMGDDSNTVLMRVADVIQVNVGKGLKAYSKTDYVHPAGENFKMEKANTYMEIEAKVKVEPLLISQDWFENMSGGRIEYLQYDYSTIAGY